MSKNNPQLKSELVDRFIKLGNLAKHALEQNRPELITLLNSLDYTRRVTIAERQSTLNALEDDLKKVTKDGRAYELITAEIEKITKLIAKQKEDVKKREKAQEVKALIDNSELIKTNKKKSLEIMCGVNDSTNNTSKAPTQSTPVLNKELNDKLIKMGTVVLYASDNGTDREIIEILNSLSLQERESKKEKLEKLEKCQMLLKKYEIGTDEYNMTYELVQRLEKELGR
jgi:predicted O-linked N-acetylglucosamine transferase (SPINDLY family)